MLMYKGTEIVNFMESQLGNRGAQARAYCGLGAGQPWCNAEVDYAAYKCGAKTLLFDGRKETYCPSSIKWCYKNLADIPVFLALPGDVVYFDWELNGVPNHIGFVRSRVSDVQLNTVEGNTSGGIVANKVREAKYIQAVFRPHYPVDKKEYNVTKKLVVDGQFGFNSIACLQKALMIKVDGILGQETVKALQRLVKVTADGSWGVKTTKAVQKMVGVKVDGYCGEKTVKALQKWINKQLFTSVTATESTTASKKKSKYYSESVIIGQATADEHGNIRGGKAGDQTGKEVATGKWSHSSKSGAYNHWTHVFRAKDKATRLKLAQAMLDACANKHVGYDQGGHDRGTLYDEAKKVKWKIADVKKNCETTCASVVSVCLRAAGFPESVAPRYYDSTEIVKHLKGNKDFTTYTSDAYTAHSNKLQPGDILVSKGHHTCMVVKSPHVPEIGK